MGGGEHVKKVESSGIGIKLINYANSQGILRLRKHLATETLRCFAFAFEGGKTNLLTNEEISKCYISEWWKFKCPQKRPTLKANICVLIIIVEYCWKGKGGGAVDLRKSHELVDGRS